MAAQGPKQCSYSHYHRYDEEKTKGAWKFPPLLSDLGKSYDQERWGDRVKRVQVSESLTGDLSLDHLGSVTSWPCDLVSLPKPLWLPFLICKSESNNIYHNLCINWECAQSTQPSVPHIGGVRHGFLLFPDPSCEALETHWVWEAKKGRPGRGKAHEKRKYFTFRMGSSIGKQSKI